MPNTRLSLWHAVLLILCLAILASSRAAAAAAGETRVAVPTVGGPQDHMTWGSKASYYSMAGRLVRVYSYVRGAQRHQAGNEVSDALHDVRRRGAWLFPWGLRPHLNGLQSGPVDPRHQPGRTRDTEEVPLFLDVSGQPA